MASNVLSNAFKKSFSKLTDAVGFHAQAKAVSENTIDFLSQETKAILQALPDGASLHLANGNAVWVSEKSEEVFHQNTEALSGKGFYKSINPQDKLCVLKAFSDCRSSGQNQTVNFRCQFSESDGSFSSYRYEMRISHFTNSSEELYLALVRDVTDQEILLSEARAAAQKAQTSNSTKSLFLSNMSHELRTPLNAIIGFSQMLMGEAAVVITEEKKAEYAGLINQSASHLLNIINDILDLSKIEAGKFQIIPELVELPEVLEESINLMSAISDESGINLSSNIASDVPRITADPRSVRQILINLLANAIKFSSKDDEVRVTLKRNRRKINLEVIDNGLGMTQETIDQLGGSFFQAEQSASRNYQGTGLGLSIVFGLVKLHQGNITFKSKPGCGTTVSVELPISNELAIPVPSDPNEAIVFLNEAREPNLLRKLEPISTARKTG